MQRTDNPVMDALLDATLTGNDRRLLLVGAGSGHPAMILFNAKSIEMLESFLADAEKTVEGLKLAIALSRVGLALGVEVHEYNDKGERVA